MPLPSKEAEGLGLKARTPDPGRPGRWGGLGSSAGMAGPCMRLEMKSLVEGHSLTLGQLHLQGCLILAPCAALPIGMEGIRLSPDHMCLMQKSPGLSLKKKGLADGGCLRSSWWALCLRNRSFEPQLVPACPGRPPRELCSPIISPTSLSWRFFKKHLPLLSSFQQIWLQLGMLPDLPLQVSRGEFSPVSGVSVALINPRTWEEKRGLVSCLGWLSFCLV